MTGPLEAPKDVAKKVLPAGAPSARTATVTLIAAAGLCVSVAAAAAAVSFDLARAAPLHTLMPAQAQTKAHHNIWKFKKPEPTGKPIV